MPKITMEQALAFADAEKFSGDRTAPGLQKWLKSFDGSAVATLETDPGKEVPINELDIDEAKPRKVFSIPATVAAAAGTHKGMPGFDDDAIKAKVQAELAAAMKAVGLQVVNGRPQLIDPGAVTVKSVKSSDERMYEDRIQSGAARFQTYENARLFHDYFCARMSLGTRRYDQYEKHNKAFGELNERIYGKAYTTTSATSAGPLVPTQFIPDLIRNVNEYGAFSQLTKIYSTSVPKILLPRRTGGLTAYWPAQNTAATQSTATYDNVALDAQTVQVLCTASMQMLQDSGVNFVDTTMEEIALAIATIKDQCLLIGDGSATYGGMTGFDKKFGTVATDAGGYVVVGGTTADAHTVTNLALLIARVPQYAQRGARWTCSQPIKGAVFDRLTTSTSVTALTRADISTGPPLSYFLGYPIVVNNVMNSAIDASVGSATYPGFTAGDMPDILFGNFERASKMIDLLDVELDMSDQRGFDTYTMWFRGVARFQSNVHDVGSSTAAGPVVSLWQT